jgi:hypothetical protein
MSHPLDPCPVGPDTLRHLDAEQKRAEKYNAAYTLLRADFVREFRHDPSGMLDASDGRRVRILEFVRDAIEDIDTGNALLADILRCVGYDHTIGDGHALATLAGLWAAQNVDAQVANMSDE